MTVDKNNLTSWLLIFFLAALLPAGAFSEQTKDEGDSWQFGASFYGWFPDLSGQTSFTPPGGGSGAISVDIENILENLEFTMMGSVEARKGRWGVFTDLIYMDLGASQTETRKMTFGEQELPVDATANVNLDLTSWIWSLAGSYQVLDKGWLKMDVIAGTRFVNVDQVLSWNITGNVGEIPIPERGGNAEVELSNWDAIVGARGRFEFGSQKSIFVPYELDVGGGDSDLTWQAVLGIGYSFGHFEIAGVWRYLYYDFSSDMAIADLSFSGPALGMSYRW